MLLNIIKEALNTPQHFTDNYGKALANTNVKITVNGVSNTKKPMQKELLL